MNIYYYITLTELLLLNLYHYNYFIIITYFARKNGTSEWSWQNSNADANFNEEIIYTKLDEQLNISHFFFKLKCAFLYTYWLIIVTLRWKLHWPRNILVRYQVVTNYLLNQTLMIFIPTWLSGRCQSTTIVGVGNGYVAISNSNFDIRSEPRRTPERHSTQYWRNHLKFFQQNRWIKPNWRCTLEHFNEKNG